MSMAVSTDEIIATVRKYGRSILRRMQEADREDAEQEVVAYMIGGTWSKESYRRAIWCRLMCLRMRSVRRLGVMPLNCDVPMAAAPESAMMANEVWRQACRDALDVNILLSVAAGYTWAQVAGRVGVAPSTIARRLRAMRYRLSAPAGRPGGLPEWQGGVVGSSRGRCNAGLASPRKN